MDVVKIGSVGNSVKITLPARVMEFMNVKIGDHVLWDITGKHPQLRKVRLPLAKEEDA